LENNDYSNNEEWNSAEEYFEYVKQKKIKTRHICEKSKRHDLMCKTHGRGYNSHYYANCKICDYEEKENWYTGIHKGYRYVDVK
jgi:hypothetical protein